MIAPHVQGWPRDLIVILVGGIVGAGAVMYTSWTRVESERDRADSASRTAANTDAELQKSNNALEVANQRIAFFQVAVKLKDVEIGATRDKLKAAEEKLRRRPQRSDGSGTDEARRNAAMLRIAGSSSCGWSSW
jgi:hypothetical protein